jgi:hypothetical protein
MNCDFKVFTTAFVVSLAMFPPAFAQDSRAQLAASAGLTPAEAQGLSLGELAVLQHNEGARRDDELVIVMHRSTEPVNNGAHRQLILASGLTPAQAADLSLNELAALNHNRNVRRDDALVIVSGRTAGLGNAGHDQFGASAGIGPDAARAMTLDEIYIVKIAKQSSDN